ncbi:MAG TPA: 50S ribosomal protein L32e [Candidatus Thermoplasmatota archaeon]|nr:50S ribosomal protein L32e [Candidatus Thermoplasmatota archaeon]
MSPDSKSSKGPKAAAAKAKKPVPSEVAKAGKTDRAKHDAASKAAEPKTAPAAKPATAPKPAAKKPVHKARAKPTLTDEQWGELGQRRAKQDANPAFHRHEWWRYKRLGGKHATWRVPRGIHSKTRRHWGYRPPLVSIGYRTPAAARGLHPSGFQEVLVHNLDELTALDKATQAARLGGTVGGRKAEALTKKADELGIRVLNRRHD